MNTTRTAFSLWRKQFDPPPSLDTARRWAAAGTIQLWQATPHGRVYVIDERTTPAVTAEQPHLAAAMPGYGAWLRARWRSCIVSRNEIIRSAVARPDGGVSCIYALLQDDEIVYVGKAATLHIRLEWHRNYTAKQFNRVWVSDTFAKPLLDTMEAMYIVGLMPPLNKRRPTFYYAEPAEVRKAFGLATWTAA